MTPDPVAISPNYTLNGLQNKLHTIEATFLVVTNIVTEADETVVLVEEGDVPLKSLKLFLDPAGNLPPPSGATLICRGIAYVQNTKQKVAAFRSSDD